MGALIDLTGQQFGYWKVLERAPSETKGVVKWLCECKCGTIKAVKANSLRRGESKSCGCLQREKASQTLATTASTIYNNLEGEHIDFLTVQQKTDERASNGAIVWKCVCDCGNIVYKNIAYGSSPKDWDIEALQQDLARLTGILLPMESWRSQADMDVEKLIENIIAVI